MFLFLELPALETIVFAIGSFSNTPTLELDGINYLFDMIF